MSLLRESIAYGFLYFANSILNLVKGIIIANLLGPYYQGVKSYAFQLMKVFSPIATLQGRIRINILNKETTSISSIYKFVVVYGFFASLVLIFVINLPLFFKVIFFTLPLTYILGGMNQELRGRGKYTFIGTTILAVNVANFIIAVVLTYYFGFLGFVVSYFAFLIHAIILFRKKSSLRPTGSFMKGFQLLWNYKYYILAQAIFFFITTAPFIVYKLLYSYYELGMLAVTFFLSSNISLFIFEALQPYTNKFYADDSKFNLNNTELVGIFAVLATGATFIFGKWIAKFFMPKYVTGFDLLKFTFIYILSMGYIANRLNLWFKTNSERQFVFGNGGVSAILMAIILVYSYFWKISNIQFLVLVSLSYLITHLLMIPSNTHKLYVLLMFLWANLPLFVLNPLTFVEAVVATAIYIVWLSPFIIFEELRVGLVKTTFTRLVGHIREFRKS